MNGEQVRIGVNDLQRVIAAHSAFVRRSVNWKRIATGKIEYGNIINVVLAGENKLVDIRKLVRRSIRNRIPAAILELDFRTN